MLLYRLRQLENAQQSQKMSPTKFSRTTKIFGLQEAAREKIKQEETKVQVYSSKLQNIFVQIGIYQKTCLLAKFLSSPIHRDKSTSLSWPKKL